MLPSRGLPTFSYLLAHQSYHGGASPPYMRLPVSCSEHPFYSSTLTSFLFIPLYIHISLLTKAFSAAVVVVIAIYHG